MNIRGEDIKKILSGFLGLTFLSFGVLRLIGIVIDFTAHEGGAAYESGIIKRLLIDAVLLIAGIVILMRTRKQKQC